MAFFVSSTCGAAAVGVGVAAEAFRPRCAATRLGTTVRIVRAIERRGGRRMGFSVRYPGSDTSAQNTREGGSTKLRRGGRSQQQTLRPTQGPLILPSSYARFARIRTTVTTPSDPIELTAQLMAIDSTSGREGDVVAWLDRYLADRGWRTTRIPV